MSSAIREDFITASFQTYNQTRMNEMNETENERESRMDETENNQKVNQQMKAPLNSEGKNPRKTKSF